MPAERTPNQMEPNLVREVSRRLLHLLSKDVNLIGEDNIPKEGPAIIVTNHMGILEVLPPLAFSPETPIILTKMENFRVPLLANLLKKLGSIPVHRDEVDRQALGAAIAILAEQKGIIFTCPEGTRGRDRDSNRTILKKAKNGVILIAQRAANKLQIPIPISPWAIWGTEGVLPEIDEPGPINKRFAFHPDHVFIRIGKPYFIYPSDERQTTEGMQTRMDSVMQRIRDMLPEKYHGFYAEPPLPEFQQIANSVKFNN